MKCDAQIYSEYSQVRACEFSKIWTMKWEHVNSLKYELWRQSWDPPLIKAEKDLQTLDIPFFSQVGPSHYPTHRLPLPILSLSLRPVVLSAIILVFDDRSSALVTLISSQTRLWWVSGTQIFFILRIIFCYLHLVLSLHLCMSLFKLFFLLPCYELDLVRLISPNGTGLGYLVEPLT